MDNASAVPNLASEKKEVLKSAINWIVLVSGLGYFVDTFDFFLYNSMRVVSLTELGLSGDLLTKAGITILNCQIFGALIGSFVWGMLGDKLGRKKSMLGSILIYSLGMVATGLVHDPISYAIARLITGFGVAGEVGLGATLIAETVTASKRTYALMFFTVMGVLGVVLAGTSIEFVSWRSSCIVGGVLGILLLALRGMLFESKLFVAMANTSKPRGSLLDLFGKIQNLKRYALCIPLLGSNFFITGVLLTLSPEIARATAVQGLIKANIVLALYFLFAAVGDCFGAWLNEIFKSRRLVAAIFIVGNMVLAFVLLQNLHFHDWAFYLLSAMFGIFNLWAICGTILVEQFPTELRATATTSNINCSRASVILMNWGFLLLKPIGVTNSLLLVASTVFALALFCVWRLPESYGCSLAE